MGARSSRASSHAQARGIGPPTPDGARVTRALYSADKDNGVMIGLYGTPLP